MKYKVIHQVQGEIDHYRNTNNCVHVLAVLFGPLVYFFVALDYISDAYELYMFHLAYHLVNTRAQSSNYNWSNITDTLYPVLVDDYLNYFLPLNKDSLPKMPTVQAPVRSPVVHSPVAGYEIFYKIYLSLIMI